MRKLSFGLFGLSVLLGQQLGSIFGMAVAICIFMIVDGGIEEAQRRQARKNKEKKEDK